MRLTQITYKQTVSYKPYHSITVEAVATVETTDTVENAYRDLSNWVSNKIHESADREAPDRPKPFNPESVY